MSKLPTVKIQNKDYVLVSERVLEFHRQWKNGCIQTDLVSQPESSKIVIKATVTPDVENPSRVFTGYSQATVGEGYINKTSALENAETSAVGRALGFMGIGVIESIASADELNKAGVVTKRPSSDGTSYTPYGKRPVPPMNENEKSFFDDLPEPK